MVFKYSTKSRSNSSFPVTKGTNRVNDERVVTRAGPSTTDETMNVSGRVIRGGSFHRRHRVLPGVSEKRGRRDGIMNTRSFVSRVARRPTRGRKRAPVYYSLIPALILLLASKLVREWEPSPPSPTRNRSRLGIPDRRNRESERSLQKEATPPPKASDVFIRTNFRDNARQFQRRGRRVISQGTRPRSIFIPRSGGMKTWRRYTVPG